MMVGIPAVNKTKVQQEAAAFVYSTAENLGALTSQPSLYVMCM